jgi:hypothetical protein
MKMKPQERIWKAKISMMGNIIVMAADEETITPEDVEWITRTLLCAREGRPSPGPSLAEKQAIVDVPLLGSVGEGAVGPAQREVQDL